MTMICPECERLTYFASRSKTNRTRRRPAHLPHDVVMAVTTNGICNACWRNTKGKPRPSVKGLIGIKYPAIGRGPLTDEQIERARRDIENFWEARRRRGIDPEGQDPAGLYRPGRTLLEA